MFLLLMVLGIIVAVLFLTISSFAGDPQRITKLYIARDVGLLFDTLATTVNDVSFQLPYNVPNASLRLNGSLVTVVHETEVGSKQQTLATDWHYFTRSEYAQLPPKRTLRLTNFTMEKKKDTVYLFNAYEPKVLPSLQGTPKTSMHLRRDVRLHVLTIQHDFFTVDQDKILEQLDLLLTQNLEQQGFDTNESLEPTMRVVFTFISDEKSKIHYTTTDRFETEPFAHWILLVLSQQPLVFLEVPIQHYAIGRHGTIEIALADTSATLSLLRQDENKKLLASRIAHAAGNYYR